MGTKTDCFHCEGQKKSTKTNPVCVSGAFRCPTRQENQKAPERGRWCSEAEASGCREARSTGSRPPTTTTCRLPTGSRCCATQEASGFPDPEKKRAKRGKVRLTDEQRAVGGLRPLCPGGADTRRLTTTAHTVPALHVDICPLRAS